MRNSILALLIPASVILVLSVNCKDDVPGLSERAVFRKLSRGDVFFPHDRHFSWGVGCFSCHHRYINGVNVLRRDELQAGTSAVSCVSCHAAGSELGHIYHRMCIKCHMENKKNGISSGPVTCGKCHIK